MRYGLVDVIEIEPGRFEQIEIDQTCADSALKLTIYTPVQPA